MACDIVNMGPVLPYTRHLLRIGGDPQPRSSREYSKGFELHLGSTKHQGPMCFDLSIADR